MQRPSGYRRAYLPGLEEIAVTRRELCIWVSVTGGADWCEPASSGLVARGERGRDL